MKLRRINIVLKTVLWYSNKCESATTTHFKYLGVSHPYSYNNLFYRVWANNKHIQLLVTWYNFVEYLHIYLLIRYCSSYQNVSEAKVIASCCASQLCICVRLSFNCHRRCSTQFKLTLLVPAFAKYIAKNA